MRSNLSRFVPASLSFAIPLLIYSFTLSPSVSFIDSGELAVVCYTLGISHPTGYPLYTLIGKIICGISISEVIVRLNFLSALLASITSFILLFALRKVIRNLWQMEIDSLLSNLTLAGMCIYFALMPAIWSVAIINEVYTLHILFICLILYLALKWEVGRSKKLIYLVCFLYGLSFTNHLTSILLLPSLLILLVPGNIRELLRKEILVTGGLLFLLGFSLYLFLPIRSSLNPLFDWGHPTNWHNFKSHLTGWQYQVWMFNVGSEELWKNLENFLNLLLKQFPPVMLFIVLAGIGYLLWKSLRLAVALLLLVLLTVYYGINYTIGEIENYFLPAYLALTFFLAVGIWFIATKVLVKLLNLKRKLAEILLVLTSLTLVIYSLGVNFKEQDRSKNYFAYDLASDILKSAQAPGLILCDIWDVYAPYLYIRFVENREPAKIMLDKELMRRSWYYDFIRQAYPEVYNRSKKEMDEFVRAVYPFENKQNFDPEFLEQKYQAVFKSIIEQSFGEINIYTALAKPEAFQENYVQIPEGLLYRVIRNIEYRPYSLPEFDIRGLQDPNISKDNRTKFHLGRYATMLENRAKYEAYFGYDSLAAELRQRASQFREILK